MQKEFIIQRQYRPNFLANFLSQTQSSKHIPDLLSPAPVKRFFAGAGHCHREPQALSSSWLFLTFSIVCYCVTTFVLSEEGDPDGRNDEAEDSSSQIYRRSFLLRWFLLQRRVERILSPPLCSGSQGEFPMNLALVAVGRVKRSTMSRTFTSPWSIVLI